MRLFTLQRPRSVALKFPRSLFGVDRTAFPALLKLGSASLKKVKWFTSPLSLSLFPRALCAHLLNKNPSHVASICPSIFSSLTQQLKTTASIPHDRTDKKTVSLRRFRSGKKRPVARSKPWPSRSGWKLYYGHQRVSRTGDCPDAVCLRKQTSVWNAEVSGPLRPIPGASLFFFFFVWKKTIQYNFSPSLDPQLLETFWFLSFWASFFFWAFPLFRSSQKTLLLLSPSPLWVDRFLILSTNVSVSTSFLFPNRRENPLLRKGALLVPREKNPRVPDFSGLGGKETELIFSLETRIDETLSPFQRQASIVFWW